MKERPILFSAPMVNAILDGRKTQTRRKVNYNSAIGGIHPAVSSIVYRGDGWWGFEADEAVKDQFIHTFPFHTIRLARALVLSSVGQSSEISHFFDVKEAA